jgi:hypothetical protein
LLKKLIPCMLFTLTSCHSPKIIEGYDEFKQQKTCKLDSCWISRDYSIKSARNTYVSFSRLDASNIQATVSTTIVNNYPSLSKNARLVFKLTYSNGGTEILRFIGKDYTQTSRDDYAYTQYGTFRTPIEHSAVVFNLSLDQLNKVINAVEIQFDFEAGKEPIRGTLAESEKQMFKEFLSKCYPK